MEKHADIIIISNNIYQEGKIVSGFVAIADDSIIKVGSGKFDSYIKETTSFLNVGDKLVCPGLIDTHCFFSGYALQNIGKDLSKCTTVEEIEKKMLDENKKEGLLLVGAHAPQELLSKTQELEKAFSSLPTILYSEGEQNCWLNKQAKEKFGFDGEDMSFERQWQIIKAIMNDREAIAPLFHEYMKMLNQRGITAVKEMGFDDYYGFTNFLQELEENKELSLRINFMSQPVGAPLDIEYAKQMRKKTNSLFLKFTGFNIMLDGSIGDQCADLKKTYENGTSCQITIDYKEIERNVLQADKEGFRVSLHSQGDGATERALRIFGKCKKNDNGSLVNCHAITDLELTDISDINYMAELGIVAEIYPQIMSIYPNSQKKISLIKQMVGNRAKYYWNRRYMKDKGVILSCATDLPLVLPDLGESIYNSCFGKFNDGTAFNQENTLTVNELLDAWTYGGAYNLSWQNQIGTLKEGKKADIIILDRGMENIQEKDIREMKIIYTIFDGKIVFDRKEELDENCSERKPLH